MAHRNLPRFAPLALATAALTLTLGLTGCALTATAPSAPVTGAAISGVVHGGQQPISGAHIYLMAAAVSGSVSAGNGYGNASISMLSNTGYSDSVGSYVLTDGNGNFNITGDYHSCSVTGASTSSQVYLYATGGSEGDGNNSATGLLAALGTCGSLSSSTAVFMDEVTTIAAAYALSGFATDATHVSIPAYTTGTTPDTLAATGLANAFANAALLASTTTGAAPATNPNSTAYGSGVIPQTTINTLANILAACVNSADTTVNSVVTHSTNCQTLLNAATSNGIAIGSTGAGTAAANTAVAAINIAHYPASNVATLFPLPSPSAPFAPALPTRTTPNDFTLGIVYSGGGITGSAQLAIDPFGNAWITQPNAESIVEISSSGSFLSGTSGYSNSPYTSSVIALDQSGNAWILNSESAKVGNLTKLSSNGTPATGSPFGGSEIVSATSVTLTGLAIDKSGNAWVVNGGAAGGYNTYVEVSPKGTTTGSNCYSACQNEYNGYVAFDAQGNLWTNGDYFDIYENFQSISLSGPSSSVQVSSPLVFDSNGNLWSLENGSIARISVSGSVSTFSTSGFSGVAFDGANNAWAPYAATASVYKFTPFPANNSLSAATYAVYSGNGTELTDAASVAIDSSGNVWMTTTPPNVNSIGITIGSLEEVVELIGAATPVVTPIAGGLVSPYTPASRP